MKSPRSFLSPRRALSALLLIAVASAALAVTTPELATDAPPAARSDVVLLIAYVLLALVVSFMCSIAEAVLLSITPSFIAGLRESQPRRAALLKQLKQDKVDQSLAAILTLNTIAHTVGAIGSGSKATAVFGDAWFGIFSAVMTLLILFLSEIIPKTLGAVYWRSLSAPTARFVSALIKLMYPLIWISELLTRLVSRGKKVHVFSRDEFVAMAGIGEQAGHINESESRIIRNLFRMESLVAQDVMTPRTVIVGLAHDATVGDAQELVARRPFSRLPLFDGDFERVSGFVMRDDVLLAAARGERDARLSAMSREIMRVATDVSLSDLLDGLLDQRRQIAMVVDEFGSTVGLVTLEDVVETLLGTEIVDETDRVEDMQALARRLWERRARALGLETISDDGAGATEPATEQPRDAGDDDK